MKRIISMSMFLLFAGACFSASLTVLVNQRDTLGTLIFENTRIFEDGLINYFFETGTIVSNEPVSLEHEYKGAYQAALDASKKGCIDYLAVFTVEADAETQNISVVHWRLIHVDTGAVVEEGNSSAPSIHTTADMQRGLWKFAEQNGIIVSKAMAKKR